MLSGFLDFIGLTYLNGEVLLFLKDFLKSLDKIFYELVAFVIMPNHIHLLFKQIEDLKVIIKKIKGESAFRINKMLNRSGRFWEKNYFDKVVRDEKHFGIVYDYIKHNGLKAGLEDWKERFYGIYG